MLYILQLLANVYFRQPTPYWEPFLFVFNETGEIGENTRTDYITVFLLLYAHGGCQTLRLFLKFFFDAMYKMANLRWQVLEWCNSNVMLVNYSPNFLIIAWALDKLKKCSGLKRANTDGLFNPGRGLLAVYMTGGSEVYLRAD